MAAAFLVGIDLGTTNVVVACAPIEGDEEPRVFAVPQLVTATEGAPRSMLPSALYAPLEAEGGRDPWGEAPWAGGEYAKRRGAEVTGRFVASAKSWLAHDAVDRHAAILPWGAVDEGAPRISPVDASARYLEHVRRAWDAAHPDAPLAEQEIVLTVPASFDEAARELTLEAANAVGLAPRLLEEPTAAFYDWMRTAGGEAGLAELVTEGRPALVLVCDVGGGTTDLSLIKVARAATPAGVEVTREAVGRHLLLGGDNMDLALALACEARMTESKLDAARFGQLVAACRGAKETLLARGAPDEVSIAIAGAGARLVGSTLRATVSREEAERIVLEGFWPAAPRDAEVARARGGLVAFGLPYERDVAITRHVASFFARHTAERAPTAMLLNGGVFRADRIAERLVASIDAWGGAPLRVLPNADPDLAVARGAVAYALARRGRGIRIGGGSSRGYYVEVASSDGGRSAVCVVPRGAREGVMQVARSRPLALVVGRAARFALWASDEATGDASGDVVVLDEERFTRLPPIAATFGEKESRRGGGEESVAVALEGELTEIGTLDLACIELAPAEGAEARRFKLAFALRDAPRTTGVPPSSVAGSVIPASRGGRQLDEARLAIAKVFGRLKGDAAGRETKDLVRELERLLGDRGTWETSVARALFDALVTGKTARRRSADHERVFWQLAGFCLRPGFGDAGDAARVAAIAYLPAERLAFPDQARGWQQFFIAWRRVAGGLDDAAQTALRDLIDPWLSPAEARKGKKSKGARPLADAEMLELAASLERVPAARRAELGGWVIERTWTDRDPRLWGAIGRIGARVPAYASVDHVVAVGVAERWVEQLLREKWGTLPGAVDAAVRLSRVTGDRGRDLSERLRKDVAKRLAAAGASAEQVRAVSELVVVEEEERVAFWGEALPVGLRLG